MPLKDWPVANWQSFIFGNLEKCFHTSQTAENFFKFYCHFLGRRKKGVFPVPLASRKSFEVLPIG
jgi:hypothetical protein